ncbi:MAG TPA: hypothetical protein PLA50_12795 [Bacteroidia bacterium]|nr:hypothetical protein [Bacteroidia bacterium]
MSPRPLTDRFPGFALAALSALLAHGLQAQDWRPLLRPTDSFSEDGIEIDAPEGVVVLAAPSADAQTLQTVPGPIALHAVQYLETGGTRYYLTPESQNLLFDGKQPYWVAVPGSNRAKFIAGTTPAALVGRETRDFFNAGPQTAEVYEETVNLEPEVEWGDSFRRAEIDFRLPVKVSEFRSLGEDTWELVLAVHAARESNPDRIPGPQPEVYGEPYQVLVTRPVQREIKVRGNAKAERLATVFRPGTVWAAGFSEGRVQEIRIGWHDLQPPYEVSRLSVPLFTRGGTMSFRFQANRLLDTPVMIEATPDLVVGVDWTVYDLIAQIGGDSEAEAEEDKELEALNAQLWNLAVDSRLAITVLAPLTEGRGAAGSIELEGIDLVPTDEEEAKALADMAKAENPPAPIPDSPGWISNAEQDLGSVPESQRGPESQF